MNGSMLSPAHIGAAFAFVSGLSFYRAYALWMRSQRHRRSVQGELGARSSLQDDPSSLYGKVVSYMERLTQAHTVDKKGLPSNVATFLGKGFASRESVSGLKGLVSEESFAESKLRFAVILGAVGFIAGLVFSTELSMVLLLAGAIFGWMLPYRAIKHRIEWRASELEEHLPEMLDVIALGMRSGLSFDSSLKLYSSHFNTILAREFRLAQCQWSSGLERRDEALRRLAKSYASPIFERLIETMIRSMRFGSSMVASLEEDAREARSAYKARKEERIAKAPVKMMIPTGTLILPAMLIMVLGPVLLELMGGAV